MDWLTDLSWVPNGAVVFISADAAGRSCKKPKTSSEVPAASTTSGGKADTAVSTRKANNTIGTVGAASGHGAGKSEDNEDEDEALALAALSRIRESYKRRARGRDTEVRGSGAEGGAREDEEGRRMLEKSREVAQTDRFRQAREKCSTSFWDIFLLHWRDRECCCVDKSQLFRADVCKL